MRLSSSPAPSRPACFDDPACGEELFGLVVLEPAVGALILSRSSRRRGCG